MHSAPQRRRALKKTKLFTCTCERCQGGPPSAIPPRPAGDGVLDLCRGFRCPHCGACGIFPPPAALCAEELARLLCSSCGRNCGTYAVGLLETEKQLRLRLEKLDEENVMELSEEEVRQAAGHAGRSGALAHEEEGPLQGVWGHRTPTLAL